MSWKFIPYFDYGTFRRHSITVASINHYAGRGVTLKFMDTFIKHWELIQEQECYGDTKKRRNKDLKDCRAKSLAGSWS